MTVSKKAVTPVKTGVQIRCKCLNRLDSGLAVIPDPDPGRNDEKWLFSTFYELINIRSKVDRHLIIYTELNCYS